MPTTPYRLLAVNAALKEAAAGVREEGGNNTGPRVRAYQASTPLTGTGWPWCAAFVNWAFKQAGRPLEELHRSPSVGFLQTYASQEGWLVKQPERGDIFCWESPADSDSWPDHTGLVLKLLADGSMRTVEGNTSGSSVAEGDGVYVKTRPASFVARCTFIRVPGEKVTKPKLVQWGIRDTPAVIKQLKALRAKLKGTA